MSLPTSAGKWTSNRPSEKSGWVYCEHTRRVLALSACSAAQPDTSEQHEPILEEDFMQKWRTAVGDKFESVADLRLLSVCDQTHCSKINCTQSMTPTNSQGNYLSRSSTRSLQTVSELVYFPASSLPFDPASRFADLFTTRPRWKAEDIAPFLADIVVDDKDRDKLLLKYARAVTDEDGLWYTTRVKL